MTLLEAAAALRRRETSSTALTRGCLDRIAALNPKLNAFLTVMGETALERARRADEELARGVDHGPLHGIPVAVNDFILDTHTVSGSVETATTGSGNSAIYAVQFGEGALAGLTSPGHITIENIGSLETKDASRTRIKWYCSLALFSNVKAGALIGVQD